MLDIQIQKETIDGCLKGQPQAQEALYRACYPAFMKICLRYTKSYDDAANVLQDSFMKIFLKLDAFKGSGDFVGWMKRIVVNTAIDFVRKQKTDGHITMHQIPDQQDENDEEEKYVIDEKNLLSLIRELPEMQLLVFNLFVMENYSHQEIANELGMSVPSSKWYLFDARRILQKKLEVYVNG